MDSKSLCVAYVLRKFPVLSETFILNEILALELAGVKVYIFSLAPTRDQYFHERLVKLRAPVHYLPGLLEFKKYLKCVKKGLAKNPSARRVLFHSLLTLNVRYIWRYCQAMYISERSKYLHITNYHAHFANKTTTVARILSQLTNHPYSFTAHAFDIFTNLNRRVLTQKCSNASFVVTISKYNYDYLKNLMNEARCNLHLVRNGIDLHQFNQIPVKSPQATQLLAVSRLVEKKGIPDLVEACHLLMMRGIKYQCVIVGKGILKKSISERIRTLSLEKNVKLVGGLKIEDVKKYYDQSHIFVLPALVANDGNREGLPVSIIEALACGLPVVSTNIAGIPEAVKDNFNGLIVPSKNPEELANALELLLSDSHTYRRLQCNARSSILNEYDIHKTSQELINLFLNSQSSR